MLRLAAKFKTETDTPSPKAPHELYPPLSPVNALGGRELGRGRDWDWSCNSSPPIGEELKKMAVNGATVKKMYERKAHNGNGKVKISYGRWALKKYYKREGFKNKKTLLK